MKNPFKLGAADAKNALRLIFGTSISQLITIIVSPLLTRLYTPAEFGEFGLFIAIVALLSLLSTLRYETAIIQAKDTEEAKQITLGSIGLSLIFSIVLMLMIFLFGKSILRIFQLNITYNWIYLIPIYIFSTGIYQTLMYWLNRVTKYGEMSRNRVLNASLTGVGNISMAYFRFGSLGLILGNTIGQVISSLILLLKFFRGGIKIELSRIIATLRFYLNFPKFDLPAALFNVASQQLPNVILVPLFGVANAGIFYLIQRVFLKPITLISGSIGSVFRQKATELYHNNESTETYFLKTAKTLFIISFIPTVLLMVLAESIFSLLFGEKWISAGRYAAILAPMYMLKFIVSPLTYMFYIKNKLKFNFYGQLIFFISILGSIFTGYLFKNFEISIWLISITGSIIYSGYFIISFRWAKG